MPEKARGEFFEEAVLPHLDAAHNLARWLTGNEHDAEDVVQEAYLRALRFFGRFNGQNGRPWLLAIVRNTFFTWLEGNRSREHATTFDEEIHSDPARFSSPDASLAHEEETELLRKAMEELSLEFREVVVLRDLEGLSYKEISDIVDVPQGTVMSRLARGRERLRQSLANRLKKEA